MQNKLHINKKRHKKNKLILQYKPSRVLRLVNKQLGVFVQNQIESARINLTKQVKRSSKLYTTALTKVPTTKKSRGSRMGKGQGKFNKYIYIIKPGQVIFKLYGFSERLCFLAMQGAKKKLPSKTLIHN